MPEIFLKCKGMTTAPGDATLMYACPRGLNVFSNSHFIYSDHLNHSLVGWPTIFSKYASCAPDDNAFYFILLG